MTLVLAFSPFILFSVLSRLSADLALWIAFAAAFVVTIRDFIESPSLRLLDGASLVLFGALALLRGFLEPELPLAAVRTIVDAVLLAVIILSLVRGRLFSLAYARERAASAPEPFLRVNRVISWAWVAAFALMAVADGVVTLLPGSALRGHCGQRHRAEPRHQLHLALSRAGGASSRPLAGRTP